MAWNAAHSGGYMRNLSYSTAETAERATGTLLTKAATLDAHPGRKRAKPRTRPAKTRKNKQESHIHPSIEELEAAVEAVEESASETELLSLVLQEWSRRQLVGTGAGSRMISLAVRAYTATGAHHMALALFEATKSEKLSAKAYGALLQVRSRRKSEACHVLLRNFARSWCPCPSACVSCLSAAVLSPSQ
jgi:hypothetical protein